MANTPKGRWLTMQTSLTAIDTNTISVVNLLDYITENLNFTLGSIALPLQTINSVLDSVSVDDGNSNELRTKVIP